MKSPRITSPSGRAGMTYEEELQQCRVNEALDKMEREIERKLSKANKPEPKPGAKYADAMFLTSFKDKEDAELFVSAWHCLAENGFVKVVVDTGIYDWIGTNADLRRLCDCYEFNNWAGLCRYVKVKGGKINHGSIKATTPSYDTNPSWQSIEKVLVGKGLIEDLKSYGVNMPLATRFSKGREKIKSIKKIKIE